MNQSLWDILITGGILISLLLAVISRITHQTIPELIKSIKEIFQSTGESAMEEAMVWEE